VAYRYLGGLRYAEIAGLAGGTEAAARRAAADGIARLRTTLGPHGHLDQHSPLEPHSHLEPRRALEPHRPTEEMS
jgi:hypothetical protein